VAAAGGKVFQATSVSVFIRRGLSVLCRSRSRKDRIKLIGEFRVPNLALGFNNRARKSFQIALRAVGDCSNNTFKGVCVHGLPASVNGFILRAIRLPTHASELRFDSRLDRNRFP